MYVQNFPFRQVPIGHPVDAVFCLRFWGQKTFVIRLERKFRPKIFFSSPANSAGSKEKNFERRHLLLISDQQQLLSTTYLGKCIRRLVDSLFHVCCCRADRHSRFFFLMFHLWKLLRTLWRERVFHAKSLPRSCVLFQSICDMLGRREFGL